MPGQGERGRERGRKGGRDGGRKAEDQREEGREGGTDGKSHHTKEGDHCRNGTRSRIDEKENSD